jgi:filamin
VNIFGNGLYQAQVNIPTSFIINAHSRYNPNDKIKIITHPSKYACDMQVDNNHNGIWMVNYTPHEIGEMQIDIFLGDKLLNSNPFKVNIFDINQIYISNINDGIINHLVQFFIDASKAGIGQLDVAVQDGQISCDAISHGSSKFDVTFLPRQCGQYKIDIRFNGLTIPGDLHQ